MVQDLLHAPTYGACVHSTVCAHRLHYMGDDTLALLVPATPTHIAISNHLVGHCTQAMVAATIPSCLLCAGLGCTLILLAVAHKALPALPISIALAVVFYFVSRFVMEPVVLPMTLQMVYF